MKSKSPDEYNIVWVMQCPKCKAMGLEWTNGKVWLIYLSNTNHQCPECGYECQWREFNRDYDHSDDSSVFERIPKGCLYTYNEQEI